MNASLKKFIISIVDHGFFVATILLVNIFIMRTADLETFGLYTVYYSIFIIFVGLHNALILEPFTVFSMGKFKEDIAVYYGAMLRLHARFGMAVVCLSLLCLFIIVMADRSYLGPQALGWSLLPVGILAVFIWKLCRVTYYVKNREIFAALAAVCFGCLTLLGCAFLYFTASISALNVILLLLAIYCVPMLIGLIGNRRPNAIDESKLILTKSYWKEHVTYSKWIVGSALVLPLTYNGYFWFLAYYSELRLIAEIKSVVQLIGVFQQLLAALFLVIIRELSVYVNDTNYGVLVNKLIKAFLVGVVVITLIYIPFIYYGDYIVTLIYGEQYTQISVVFKYCLMLTIFQLGSYLLNVVLKTLLKSQIVFYGYCGAALVAVIIGFYLAKTYGLLGVIAGLIFSEIAVFSVMLFFVVRYIRQDGAVPKA